MTIRPGGNSPSATGLPVTTSTRTPPEEYDALKAADSKGAHINTAIKPRYRFHRKAAKPSGRKG
jgi:hypothetical protein